MSCPCGLSDEYEQCCGVYHRGAEPSDAEQLMRSRFSGFVKGELPYLWKTLHRDHTDKQGDFESWAKRFRKSLSNIRYRQLRVLDVAAPDSDGVADVLFHVLVSKGRRDASFAEHSHFVHNGDGWRYVDGTTLLNRELPKPIEALTFRTFREALARQRKW